MTNQSNVPTQTPSTPASESASEHLISRELTCLRTHIVDFLEYQLKNDLITEKRAGQLAQAVLDQLLDNLNHDQIHQVMQSLESQFPEELKNLEASSAACETAEARHAVDQKVLEQVTAGNIDAALQTLDKFKVR